MVIYREASENDFEKISRLIKSREELFLVYPNGTFPFTPLQVKELSETRKDLTVVEAAGEIIGFANFYDFQPGKFVFIGNVIIEESVRGRGHGRKLVSYMLNRAFTVYSLPEVRISVFNTNTQALLLYSSFGFSPYEIEKRISPQGTRVALIHMKGANEEGGLSIS